MNSNELQLFKIPSNGNSKINIFIAILMSFYSSYCKEFLITNDNNKKKELNNIIHTLINYHYYNTTTTSNFFKIIKPQILLLKFLNIINYDLRTFLLENNTLDIPLTFLCDIHHHLNLKCMKIFNFNNSNNFYCYVNNFYSYSYFSDIDNTIIFYLNSNNINKNDIKNYIKEGNDIIMIQKENKTSEAEIVENIINLNDKNEKILNIDNYDDNTNSIKHFDDIITFNYINYKLDTCIIKSNINDNYIILLHFNKNKYLYDINNNNLFEYDWSNLNKFNYNQFDFNTSPSLIATYIII